MIQPSVGRVLWYYPREEESIAGAGGSLPLTALVCKVWSDRLVNLCVFDANGVPTSRTSVCLAQPEDERPLGAYCAWMPYQIGQAQKAEQLQGQLAAQGHQPGGGG